MLLNVISGNLGYYWFKKEVWSADLYYFVYLYDFVHKFSIALCFYSGVMLNELRKWLDVLVIVYADCIISKPLLTWQRNELYSFLETDL